MMAMMTRMAFERVETVSFACSSERFGDENVQKYYMMT
jgi:hypothetical protein